mmetsp:Transcript_6558/g.9246  ORF Transcript_6558/g.9246 Transcript_6558/m.9246 type:complete len:87 (+) Transcript_6558:99-359(+)
MPDFDLDLFRLLEDGTEVFPEQLPVLHFPPPPPSLKFEQMLNLEPGKFREVRNMKTYLCVNGSRSKVVLRVSRRNKATVPYHDGRI